MSIEIYTWGNGSEVAIFEPESLAIAKFVTLCCSNQAVKLIPNSNYFVSKNGKLPLMIIDGNTQVQGYKEITNYFIKNSNVNNYVTLNKESEIVNQGFLEYLTDNFQIITSYNLFYNKENYESYSRGLFKTLLPFPLQYKPPLTFKARAFEICDLAGISTDNSNSKDDEQEDEMRELKERERQIRETPVLSKTQRGQIDGLLKSILSQKNVLTNMKCINLLEETIKDYINLKSKSTTKNLFDDVKYCTSEILMYSYLESNIIPELKSNFFSTYTKQNYPELIGNMNELNNVVGDVKTEVIKLTAFGALRDVLYSL